MNVNGHLRAIVVLLWLASSFPAGAAEPLPSPQMLGHWSGTGRIIVTWYQQTNLTVSLQINPDASVTGVVGDARLIDGRLRENRNWLERTLRLKTDYIITGRLEGSIVAREQIYRRGVMIPLTFSGTSFCGSVHSTGTHIGGKTHMVLTAACLKLHRDSL